MSAGTVPENGGLAQIDGNQIIVDRLLDGENKLDRWLIRWGDFISPIVVKETRQALKSRQFIWTYVALILAILGWSLYAVIENMPGIYYLPRGDYLLAGYIFMLMVPAFIIVPLAAFFSMSNELSSNTFEVLSVSPMSSRSIAIGKLAVAGVQLLLYSSLLAPCIAFTYLLRGVSLMELAVAFPFVGIIAFVLISISVMLGALGKSLSTMVFFLIVEIAVCFSTFIGTATFLGETDFLEMVLRERHGLYGLGCFLTIIGSYGVLAILISRAVIGITGENYSQAIKIWLAVQAYIIFAFSVVWAIIDDITAIYALGMLIAMHWGGAGIFLCCENAVLTPRMQRKLPSTFTSRALGMWLMPGGGLSYIFVILCAASTSFASLLPQVLGLTGKLGNIFAQRSSSQSFMFLPIVSWAYLAMYLGALRLVMLVIPSRATNRAGIALLFSVLLIALGVGVPTFISTIVNDFRDSTYEFYSFTDFFATLSRIDRAQSMGTPLVLLFFTSFVIFCINALRISSDVVVVRPTSSESGSAKTSSSNDATSDPFA